MFSRLKHWWARVIAPERVPVPAVIPQAPSERHSIFSTELVVGGAGARMEALGRLAAALFPPTPKLQVIGQDGVSTAMDANNWPDGLKAANGLGRQVGMPEIQASWYGAQGFIGYQVMALIAQHWLVNKACLIPARDAIRKGYKFTVNDGSVVDPKVIEAINRANKRFRLNRSLVEYVKQGRVFGIRLAMFIVQSDDPDYYVKPFNPDGIRPGSYRGISQIDPYWTAPELTSNAAMNPASIDFYEPTYWQINGIRVHKSHLVVMRGPEVADVLKPSYLYGGLSVPQLIYERVYASERTANEAPQLAMTKRADIFYTDTAKAMLNKEDFEARIAWWRAQLDNFGVKVADKDVDKVERLDTSLADLDTVIMTQYQLVAAAANVPATKLLGTTPKGFNSTGDYETDSYHEELESIQTNDLEPLIDRHMVCLIRSEIAPRFNMRPFSVECTWNPLSTLTTKEQAEVNKINAETDKTLKDAGAIDGTDIRNRVAADEQSGYNGIPALSDEDELSDGTEDPANPQTA